jgi:RNA polymerase sigma-70 factor (ECF subfamily)
MRQYYLFEVPVVESRGVALPMPAWRLGRPDDAGAFELLLRAHEGQVARTALRLLGNRQDAQDAAQEVFLRLHRRLGEIDDTRNLSGWLYRVTVNVCRDIQRKRICTAPFEDATVAVASGTEAELSREQQLRLIESALRALPEKERAAVTLRDLEGLPTREVAQILGSSEATVRSQISAARLKIRKILRRQL